jgi:hypothetical protein
MRTYVCTENSLVLWELVGWLPRKTWTSALVILKIVTGAVLALHSGIESGDLVAVFQILGALKMADILWVVQRYRDLTSANAAWEAVL